MAHWLSPAWSNALMFDLPPGSVLLNPLPQFHVGGSIFGALSASRQAGHW